MDIVNDMMNFADMVSANENTKPLIDTIEQIMSIPDEQLNDKSIEIIKGMINGAAEAMASPESINEMIEGFEQAGQTRAQVSTAYNTFRDAMNSYINELKPSKYKRDLLESVMEMFYKLFEDAIERYHTYNIELPIMLDEGAHMPTYAHESDAAADLYALETVVVKAHTISNKIRTGAHLQLPENWCARLIPRSSTGAKTPLRLSNAQGLIDQGYTGEILVLFDNISDSDYTINAGDRIAQMWIEPIYRFKAKQVDTLQNTDRNANGFGSTGK